MADETAIEKRHRKRRERLERHFAKKSLGKTTVSKDQKTVTTTKDGWSITRGVQKKTQPATTRPQRARTTIIDAGHAPTQAKLNRLAQKLRRVTAPTTAMPKATTKKPFTAPKVKTPKVETAQPVPKPTAPTPTSTPTSTPRDSSKTVEKIIALSAAGTGAAIVGKAAADLMFSKTPKEVGLAKPVGKIEPLTKTRTPISASERKRRVLDDLRAKTRAVRPKPMTVAEKFGATEADIKRAAQQDRARPTTTMTAEHVRATHKKVAGAPKEVQRMVAELERPQMKSPQTLGQKLAETERRAAGKAPARTQERSMAPEHQEARAKAAVERAHRGQRDRAHRTPREQIALHDRRQRERRSAVRGPDRRTEAKNKARELKKVQEYRLKERASLPADQAMVEKEIREAKTRTPKPRKTVYDIMRETSFKTDIKPSKPRKTVYDIMRETSFKTDIKPPRVTKAEAYAEYDKLKAEARAPQVKAPEVKLTDPKDATDAQRRAANREYYRKRGESFREKGSVRKGTSTAVSPRVQVSSTGTPGAPDEAARVKIRQLESKILENQLRDAPGQKAKGPTPELRHGRATQTAAERLGVPQSAIDQAARKVPPKSGLSPDQIKTRIAEIEAELKKTESQGKRGSVETRPSIHAKTGGFMGSSRTPRSTAAVPPISEVVREAEAAAKRQAKARGEAAGRAARAAGTPTAVPDLTKPDVVSSVSKPVPRPAEGPRETWTGRDRPRYGRVSTPEPAQVAKGGERGESWMAKIYRAWEQRHGVGRSKKLSGPSIDAIGDKAKQTAQAAKRARLGRAGTGVAAGVLALGFGAGEAGASYLKDKDTKKAAKTGARAAGETAAQVGSYGLATKLATGGVKTGLRALGAAFIPLIGHDLAKTAGKEWAQIRDARRTAAREKAAMEEKYGTPERAAKTRRERKSPKPLTIEQAGKIIDRHNKEKKKDLLTG